MFDSSLATLVLLWIIVIDREVRPALPHLISSVANLNICHHRVTTSEYRSYFHTIEYCILGINNFHFLIMCYRENKRSLIIVFRGSYATPAARAKSSKDLIELRLNNNKSIRMLSHRSWNLSVEKHFSLVRYSSFRDFTF